MDKDLTILLLASFVIGCGALSLLIAVLSGDRKHMGALFSTVHHLFHIGAGAVISLLIGRLH